MSRENRLSVTLTRDMTVALHVLAERSGLAPSTQAMVLLRQALDRTIHSRDVQEQLRATLGVYGAVDRRRESVLENRLNRAAQRIAETGDDQ